MFSESTKNKIKTDVKIKILIVIITIVLIVLMFPQGESIESEVTVGSIWTQSDLIASMPFEILKDPETYNKEKKIAAGKVYPVFVVDNTIARNSLDSLRKYNKYLKKTIDEDLSSGVKSNFNTTFLSDSSYRKFKEIRKFENVISINFRESLNKTFNVSKNILSLVYKRKFFDRNYNQIAKDSVAVREGKFENIVPKTYYNDLQTAKSFLKVEINKMLGKDEQLNKAVYEYLLHFLKPNIIFSQQLTEQAVKLAEDKVPKNIGIIEQNERIVAKHDRITPITKLKIDSYRIAKGQQRGSWMIFFQNLGKFLHIIVVLGLFVIYLFLFRKKIFDDNSKILIISIVLLFTSFLTFLVYQMNVKAPVQLLVLIPVASMLLTILFDSRVGFYGTVAAAFIAGGLRGNDYVFTLMNIFAGGLAAYTVRDIKNRSQIFRSFLYILIGYIIGIIAFGLERFDSVEHILIQSGFAASNALMSPVLTYGLIIFFEKIFKITTELTLLELSDFNNPLLRELTKNAPGTFNHSMTIGTMVESAAESIGANPILARVGAYYHDIGKTLNPEAFVENQMNNINIHEKLEPTESARIIIAHVTDGIKLAKEHKLPDEIINFIPTHHGKMIVSFFYEKAVEKYGEENVDIEDFRYPGPKPNTKETALLMLADACESTVRAMKEPEVQKIENVINNLTQSRIQGGQLDDAPITFADLAKIKESFLNTLISQHHKRIRYPKQDEMENESNENNESNS
ncbi:hypothetical protein BMS3Abin04_00551 [bacterium BMS3Abin04]|nr:hypothetical protein BMS3Abin04_00551 [bacterium BMS3Abin04]